MELELELLDASTLSLAPVSPLILEKAPKGLREFLKPEAYQCMIELVSPVCEDLEELEAFLREKLLLLEEFSRKHQISFLTLSLHPFARAKDQILYQDPRYESIFRELCLVGRRFIAQGLHIHLGMPDQDTALRVYNALLPYLPLFLALTTSSPFFEGEETGFHSYRTKLFEVLPLAGLPRFFKDWHEFEELLLLLKRLGIIKNVRDLWWDIRLQPALGTVEIRICDTPGRFKDLLATVAFVKALAQKLLEEERSFPPREVILYGKWQAARHGLDGLVADSNLRRLLPIRQLIKQLKRALGSSLAYSEEMERLLEQGPLSYRMLALFHSGATLAEIIQTVRREFWE